jgi:hypothetical protein
MIAGSVVVGSAAVLADGDNAFGAGFIAFLVVVALCVASYFLFRSMNRHLKGLPTKFPTAPSEEAPPPTPSPAETPRQPEA